MCVSTQIALAQPADREIVNQSIQWISLTSNLKMTNRISLMLEGQFRQVQNFEPMQYQFRTAVDVILNKHFSVVPLGYVYTWNYQYGEQPAAFKNNEHRLWQQITYKHHIGRFNLSPRGRLEQRFVQVHAEHDGGVINEGYDVYLNRVRYRFMATVPFNHSKIEPQTYFGACYDEVFVSWGDLVTFHEPDQNRLFAGVGYQVNQPLAIQVGFLYQMLIKANGLKQENNVGFQVQFTYNVDFTK